MKASLLALVALRDVAGGSTMSHEDDALLGYQRVEEEYERRREGTAGVKMWVRRAVD